MAEPENFNDSLEAGEPAARFLGTWALVSFEHVLPTGARGQLFGENPKGQISYHSDGQMSAQLQVGSPKRLTGEQIVRIAPEEASEAWRGYLGYWGTFRIDARNNIVVHHVQGSSFPNWIGTEQARHFRFQEDFLILEAHSPDGISTLTWRKNAV